MLSGAGVVVQLGITAGVTATAVAPPRLATRSAALNACPTLTTGYCGVSVAPSDGGAWTTTAL